MVEYLQVKMPDFGRDCQIRVWLPDSYNSRDDVYSVMYLLNGQKTFGGGGSPAEQQPGVLDFMKQWDKEMIVVLIETAVNEKQRNEELCPFSATMEDGTQIQGRGDAFVLWIINELKPVIDQRYRTDIFGRTQGIGGCGMGGTLALYAAAKYNQWFSRAACLSGELHFVYEELSRLINRSLLKRDTRVFLGWGSNECLTRQQHGLDSGAALQISRLFVMHGCNTYPYQQEGGNRDDQSWMKLVPLFMHYLWKE
jgi:predicted alpha/beta superfamily hydrolase